MEKKRQKRMNFVDFRLQQDWNNLHKEKFTIDSFKVMLDPPRRSESSYSLTVYISAPTTIYSDKTYQVRLMMLIQLSSCSSQ